MSNNLKQVKNHAGSTTTGLNNTTSPVTFNVNVGDGTKFPTPGNPFWVTVSSSKDPGNDSNREILLVTAVSGDSLTATRGQLNTTNVAHAGSVYVQLLVEDQHFTDMYNTFPVTDVKANKPSAGYAGRIFLPTDNINVEVDNGTTWQPYGPIYPLRDPTTFTWTASSTAPTHSSTTGYTVQMDYNYDSSHTFTYLSTPLSFATPYTITAALLLGGQTSGTETSAALGVGLGLTDGSGHVKHMVYEVSGSATYLAVYYNTSQTDTSAATNTAQTFWNAWPLWLRITDDGTHRTWLYSFDGEHYWQMLQEATNTSLTPTATALTCYTNVSAQSTGLTCISFKQSNTAITTGPDF